MLGPHPENYGPERASSADKFHTINERALQSPRISEDVRSRLEQLHPDFAGMFTKRPVREAPRGNLPEPAKEVPVPKGEGFKTNPAAIDNEHAADVSAAEARGTEDFAKKQAEIASQRTTNAEARGEKTQRQLTMKHIEGEGQVIYRALNNEMTRRLANAPQEEKAREVIDKDKARAIRIAMRQEQPPDSWDLQPSFVFMELERRAVLENDKELQMQLDKSPLAKEVTTAARLVQSLSRRDSLSALDRLDEIRAERTAAAEAQAVKTHGSAQGPERRSQRRKAAPELDKAVRRAVARMRAAC